MRIFLSLAIILALSACVPLSPLPSPTPEPTLGPFVFVDEPMNVRKGPGVEFDVIGQIPPQKKYRVVGKNVDWWLIELGDNQIGWIYAPVHITNFVGNSGSVPDVLSPPTPTPEITPTCAPIMSQSVTGSEAREEAWNTLITFFELLNNQEYGEAAEIYAGGYEILRDWNPLLDPKDYAALLKSGCEINGLQCLRVKRVVEEKSVSPMEYHFVVEFMNNDGSLFVLGPCCGADATSMPPQSQFGYTVVRDCTGKFRVIGLPVCVP